MDKLIGPDRRDLAGDRLSSGRALPIRWSRAASGTPDGCQLERNPMSTSKRVLVALTTLAVAATLAFVPGLGASASAADSVRATGSVSAATTQCTSARSALSSAQQGHAKAKKKVAKKKKAVKKAKKAHNKAKVKKTKKQLKKAKKALKRANATVSSRAMTVSQACRAAEAAGLPAQVGQELGILQTLLGGDLLSMLNLKQFMSFLDALFPGLSNQLDSLDVLGMLNGFNSGQVPGLDQLSSLLGGSFDPNQLLQLLGGTADSNLIKDFADNLLGQLSGLAGGLPTPAGGFAFGGVLQTLVDAVSGNLDGQQLGGIVALIKKGLNMTGTLDVTKLTNLLDGMIPGLSGMLPAGMLTSMLPAANGAVPGVDQLSGLLGGLFDTAELGKLVSGTASPDLLNQILTASVGQLGTGAGGAPVSPINLASNLLNTVSSVVQGVFNSVFNSAAGGGLGTVCTWLPIPVIC